MSSQQVFTPGAQAGKPIGSVANAMIVAASGITLVARVLRADGNVIQQSDVASLSVEVWDKTLDSMSTSSSPSVASVIYNTLQLDGRWTADGIGYNFALNLAGASFPVGATTYRVEVKITPTTGNVFFLWWDLQSQASYFV